MWNEPPSGSDLSLAYQQMLRASRNNTWKSVPEPERPVGETQSWKLDSTFNETWTLWIIKGRVYYCDHQTVEPDGPDSFSSSRRLQGINPRPSPKIIESWMDCGPLLGERAAVSAVGLGLVQGRVGSS